VSIEGLVEEKRTLVLKHEAYFVAYAHILLGAWKWWNYVINFATKVLWPLISPVLLMVMESNHKSMTFKFFEEAKRRGIRRTVHAGEAGTAEDVRDSIAKLHAERIGHGYHVVDDAKCYEFAKQSGVHFECCPLSSRLTNSVTCPWEDHPIAQFMKDKVNFGISTDDPTVTGYYLNDEMDYVKENLRFTDAQIAQLQVNAAKAAFLPESEKQELISQIKKANNL